MRFGPVRLAGLTLIFGAVALSWAPAGAADCGAGSADEKIACLNRAVSELETKLDKAIKDLDKKASADDAIKWYDRVALMNEDMRIYPRCLDNPGPDSRNITDVMATSCAKVPAQTWMITRPYREPRKQ